jgi:hypothetical protein
MKFKNILIEVLSEQNIVYHGTPDEHSFDTRGSLFDGTFFSSDVNVAKSYGKFVYKIHINDNLSLFDFTDVKNVEIIFQNFDVLYDNYYDIEEDKHYIRSVDDFQNHSDNWSIVESTDGLMDWLRGGYDGFWIIEGGSEKNLFLFSNVKEKLKKIQRIL